MAQTRDAPTSSTFSPFYCEKAVVTDVNRATWTVGLETVHSAKSMRDVPWLAPYHDHQGGAGLHYMPEVGTYCYVATPVDTTPAFVLGFIAPPAVKQAQGEAPARSTEDPAGSATDVSYQSNRPDLNPGDIAMTTRDENFFILRRGGILQLGASPMAQRLYIPVRNFIHDYCENYELATVGGDLAWTVDRPELDPAGKAACSWSFQLQEFATDAKASVRVRHLPLADSGAKKAAWEVTVAPQGIDRMKDSVSGATYTLVVLTDGTTTEMVGAHRTLEVKGDYTCAIDGKQAVSVKGESTLSAKKIAIEASDLAWIAGKTATHVGDANATEPAVLGHLMQQWLPTVQVLTAMGPAPLSPASIQAFADVLSKKVMLR